MNTTLFRFAGSVLLALTLAAAPACRNGATGAPVTTAQSESVKPGINERFLDPNLDVDEWVDRFEVESRDIVVARLEILEAVDLEPGMDVVDVGAGTGLFLEPFAEAVGPAGTVYAVDISEPFVDHMRRRARRQGLTQVEARVCSQTSIELPPNSVDRAFVCDVYHHFEYPQQSLASIYSALRPGGEMIVVDFERIPGVSRDWLLDHVRAGKDVFTAEIESAGFELIKEIEIPELEENYIIRFRRP